MKKGTLSKLILGLITIFILVQCAKTGAPADESSIVISKAVTLTQVSSFGTNPGSLAMYKYVPANLPSNAALVVVLHGCSQDAATYANDTGWHTLADQYKFAVIYPQTNSSNNSSKCFNWFETGDIARGAGEALSIKQMVDKMKADYSIDNSKVFVTGLSAGGYMTVVMAATYPDVFAGAAPMAGGPYKCATSMTAAFSCMSPGTDKTGADWATIIKSGYSGYTGSYPKMSIWQGTSDYTVKPMNAVEIMQGWTNILGADETADINETIQGNTHKVYKNASGTPVVETWDITGMGHGITVDPDGTNGKAGGATNGFSFDKNVWSSYQALKFFGLDNSDQTAPVASISSPANGATVSGNVTISASATDNVAVTKVEIYLDGALKTTASAASASYAWDATQSANGSHTILVKAYDAAGNVGTKTISVNVTGGLTDTQAPVVSITSPANGASLTGKVNINASASDNYGVTKVEIYVDGTLQASLTASPYTYSWDVAQIAAGSHTILAKAYDAAGNIGVSAQISVTTTKVTYSESISATLTSHYLAKRLTAQEYNDLGLGTNYSGINPGKLKYGYSTAFYLYKLISTGKWVTSQSI